MFILVLALDKYGITGTLGGFLSGPDTVGGTVASFGVSSFFAANIVNNIPMSVLYSSVVGSMEAGALTTAALFAAVIGSNLGAFFTPTGALAGIMWTGQLHDHGVPFSFIRFVKYGATVAVPAMAAALLGLWICC
jgi:arsenical pump membrane protein